MATLEVNPQTTVTAERPMPDEVIILTCDANGASGWIKMSKQGFAELAGDSWLAILEEATERMYQESSKGPSPEWALAPETLDAREAARKKYLADPGNIRPGDTVRFRDPRQQPGVRRSDDVM
jgi:hypothetical protein